MNARRLALFVLCLSLPALAEEKFHELELSVVNPRSTEGRLCLAIFGGEAGFPEQSERAVKRECVAMSALPHRVRLAEGAYAAAVFHDEDGDGLITKRLLGMPKEGYGFSNNPAAYFGPPSWKKAVFDLRADHRLLLKLTYFP